MIEVIWDYLEQAVRKAPLECLAKKEKKVTEVWKAWELKVLQGLEDHQVIWLVFRDFYLLNYCPVGPPGTPGEGIPGRAGDRGEPGRPGAFS